MTDEFHAEPADADDFPLEAFKEWLGEAPPFKGIPVVSFADAARWAWAQKPSMYEDYMEACRMMVKAEAERDSAREELLIAQREVVERMDERDALQIESSKHAHDAEVVRRERDAALEENRELSRSLGEWTLEFGTVTAAQERVKELEGQVEEWREDARGRIVPSVIERLREVSDERVALRAENEKLREALECETEERQRFRQLWHTTSTGINALQSENKRLREALEKHGTRCLYPRSTTAHGTSGWDAALKEGE
jgi:chromosome segregation ATPase